MALSANVTGAVGAWGAANTAYLVPVVVTRHFLVKNMAILNGTVAGNVDVGIYDRWFNRLVSAGSTLQAGASAPQVFNVTDTWLTPGLYFLAGAGSTVTTQQIFRITPSAAFLGRPCGVLSFTIPGATHVLPSTMATPSATGSSAVPLIIATSANVI